MKTPLKLLSAFAVATGLALAPAVGAHAGNEKAPITQASYDPAVQAQILQERSVGKVILNHGDDFSPTTLINLKSALERAGLEVETEPHGPSGKVTSYFFGQHFPAESYDAASTPELAAILIAVAKKHNLIAVAGPIEPDQG